jgi:outer membrane receptor protein involved in Fe transport
MAPLGITAGSPRITFKGFSIGGGQSLPWSWSQKVYSARDEFTYSKGHHDLKLGGEYLWEMTVSDASTSGMGIIDAQGGPTPANIEALFPDPWNADTWNLAAISPLVRRYTVSVGNRHNFLNRPKIGTWIQDDWRVSKPLTLNLGLRYDLIWDAFANQVQVLPWIIGGRPQDTNNLQPRVGFAYQRSLTNAPLSSVTMAWTSTKLISVLNVTPG